MKKIKFAFLAGAMLFGACSKDNIVEDLIVNDTAPVKSNITFSASIADNDESTRASIGESNTIVWNEGDEISVLSRIYPQKFHNKCTLSSGAGTTNGSFVGTCETGTDIYAIYPYSKDNDLSIGALNNKNLFINWNGTNQTAVLGSFPLNTPMVAYTPDVEEGATTIPLSFQNVCAFVKFTIDYACKKVVFSAKREEDNLSSENICVEWDNKKPSIWKTEGARSNAVTLTGIDGGNIVAGTYCIAVQPVTLSQGFEITMSGINNTDLTLTRSTSKSVTLNRSEVLNIGELKMNDFKHDIFFGSGTEADPYQINSYEDWVLFVNTLNSESTYSSYNRKYYKLTNNIDCSGKAPFNPVKYTFKGHLNGNNHTISNYQINVTNNKNHDSDCYSGLFNQVEDAVIENLNCVFDDFVWDDTGDFAFGISPFINIAESSIINNIHLSGADKLELEFNAYSNAYVGCLIAQLDAKYGYTTYVRNCSNALNIEVYAHGGSISSYEVYVGGIVGFANSIKYNGELKIDRCRNTGSIVVYGDNDLIAGGIVGVAKDGPDVELFITNCVNKGNVRAGDSATASTLADDAYAGGIVGKLDSDGQDVIPHIYNSLNQGKIEAYQIDHTWAGGIVGWAYSPILKDDPHLFNCANRGGRVASSGAHAFVGNTGHGYNSEYTKCCADDYYSPGEIHAPSIFAVTMNENIGYAKIQSETKNNSNWVNYTWGCCRWTGVGTTLDLDFSSSVE